MAADTDGATAQGDPHYKLLLGRLYDRLRDSYPSHEALPTANIPDGLVDHVVQHRFRVAPLQWPLVQLGPGVLTLNETEGYVWSDFERRATEVVVKLFDAHPSVADLSVDQLVLRYIDAVEFDYNSHDAFDFLRDKLKVELRFPPDLFAGTEVHPRPRTSTWQSTFRCDRPAGRVHVGFATGRKRDRPAILWETAVASAGGDVPAVPEGFPQWLAAAHDITHDWFFKLIAGDLERSFAGD